MRVSDMIPSKWVKASDIIGDQTATIDHLVNEEVGKDKELRWVVYFRDMAKGLILNVTNIRALEEAYGDESDAWTGKSVTLFTMPVDYAGRVVQGIRLRGNNAASDDGEEVSEGF